MDLGQIDIIQTELVLYDLSCEGQMEAIDVQKHPDRFCTKPVHGQSIDNGA